MKNYYASKSLQYGSKRISTRNSMRLGLFDLKLFPKHSKSSPSRTQPIDNIKGIVVIRSVHTFVFRAMGLKLHNVVEI